MIHETSIAYPGCEVDERASIGPFSIIGKPYRPIPGQPYHVAEPTKISEDVHIGPHVVVGQGTEIARGVIVDDGCTIECEVILKPDALLIYRAYVSNEAHIGSGSIIGGFICERAIVGDHARVFGKLVHKQLNPAIKWDDPELEEPSPVIDDNAFVGFNAVVAGGVRVGESAYVCAGAIITRDVPAKMIAHGINQLSSPDEWTGALSQSPALRGVNDG